MKPPTFWDAEKPVNLLWRTFIPGLGHSSPIIWGDRVFVTTAVSRAGETDFASGTHSASVASAKDTSEHEWKLYCLDKKTGRILWERTAYKGRPQVQRHIGGSYANPTPATDGRHVVAFFGSHGLYCFDFEGNLLWQRGLGILDGGWSVMPDVHWGFGSSPLIFRDLVIVQCDTQNTSFIAAFRLEDGAEVWRTERSEDTVWASPTICERDRVELVVSGTHFHRAYDPLTGEELWRLADGVDVKIPSPICSEELVLFGGGSEVSHKRYTYAVRQGARGEITFDEDDPSGGAAWRTRAIPHTATPVIYRNHMYVGRDNGVLTVFRLSDGRRVDRIRVARGGAYLVSSPVVADGRLYWGSEEGDVYVVKIGDGIHPEVISRNRVGEPMIASPALSDGIIVIRGRHHVFCFGEADRKQIGSR